MESTLAKKGNTSSARTKKADRRAHGTRNSPNHDDAEREARLKLRDPILRNRPYSGQLKTSIVRVSKLELLLRGGPEEQERIDREEDTRVLAQQLQKLLLLLDHFEILDSPTKWFHLAFYLARQHVPGMQVVEGSPPKRGPKGRRKGTPTDHEFLVALTQVMMERKRGVADAIHILKKRHPDLWDRFSKKSLQHRYSKLRKDLVPYPKGDLIDNLADLFGSSARHRKPENSET